MTADVDNRHSSPFGYNIMEVYLREHSKVSAHSELRLNDLITQLSTLNDQNRDLQKLIGSLTHAKKEKKVDYSDDEEMTALIDRLFELDPALFGHQKTYSLDNEGDIETALQLLDGRVKTQMANVNETTMYINQNYEDRIQYTENAQKTLEMMIRHIDSIISKYRAQ